MRLIVKEKAEERGYNIDSLAKASALDYSTVHRYWHDVIRRVDLKTLSRLARALRIDPRELLMLEPDDPGYSG